jgi:hypothetical protein
LRQSNHREQQPGKASELACNADHEWTPKR